MIDAARIIYVRGFNVAEAAQSLVVKFDLAWQARDAERRGIERVLYHDFGRVKVRVVPDEAREALRRVLNKARTGSGPVPFEAIPKPAHNRRKDHVKSKRRKNKLGKTRHDF